MATEHEHEPDWQSVSVTIANGVTYIDVNCAVCGQSGCIGTSETIADVQWD